MVLNEWVPNQSHSLALGPPHTNFTEAIWKLGSAAVLSKVIDCVQNIGRNYNEHFY